MTNCKHLHIPIHLQRVHCCQYEFPANLHLLLHRKGETVVALITPLSQRWNCCCIIHSIITKLKLLLHYLLHYHRIPVWEMSSVPVRSFRESYSSFSNRDIQKANTLHKIWLSFKRRSMVLRRRRKGPGALKLKEGWWFWLCSTVKCLAMETGENLENFSRLCWCASTRFEPSTDLTFSLPAQINFDRRPFSNNKLIKLWS